MRRHALGLTLIELLTVVAIIAILIGLLVPAVNFARRFAKETQQKAQLTAIDVGLTAFHNDFGDYPPSNPSNGIALDPIMQGAIATYCGAQKLAEALVGRDMRGFNPDAYADLPRTDGVDPNYPDPLDPTNAVHADNLNRRRPLYLDPGMANAFRLGDISAERRGLYPATPVSVAPTLLASNTFVLCDEYVRRTVVINTGGVSREIKLGSPILYYRANSAGNTSGSIYQYGDNLALIIAKGNNEGLKNAAGQVWLWGEEVNSDLAQAAFYQFINDSRVPLPNSGASPALGVPYRRDSYILVSAGADGRYGTRDDICNFSR